MSQIDKEVDKVEPSKEEIEDIENLPLDERVFCTVGIIASVDIEQLPKIVRFVASKHGRVIYMTKAVSGQRLIITRE